MHNIGAVTAVMAVMADALLKDTPVYNENSVCSINSQFIILVYFADTHVQIHLSLAVRRYTCRVTEL